MTPAACLQATLDLLAVLESEPRPADALVSAYFRGRRYIGSHDRVAISNLFYDMLRYQARLDWWIRKLTDHDADPSPRQHMIAYLALVEQKADEEISKLFSGDKFTPAPLDDAEKILLRKLLKHTLEHPHMPEPVVGECPAWAAASLQKRFGKNFAAEMAALLQPAPLDLRVNPLKATRETMLADLRGLKLKITSGKLSPFCIRVMERPSLAALPMLKNGAVEIQDEGSQLVALMVDARPGERVVDFCAGAGGKTLAIAVAMKNKGRIIACDVLEKRLKRSTERFRRAGLHNIEVKPLTSESDPWVKRHKGGFDRVLVDAPCSGTGTWRRNPDARWRSLGPGLTTLIPLQAKILASAARLVKAGGRLVYATCSLLPEENEQQIEAFLATHPDFEVVPLREVLPDLDIRSAHEAYLSLSPARHGTDGFFAAAMVRKLSVSVATETA